MSFKRAADSLRNQLVKTVGRKIIAVGRNYAEHAAEMGASKPMNPSQGGSPPLIFLKPTSSYVTSPGPIQIPRGMQLQHEIELGVVMASPLSSTQVTSAHIEDPLLLMNHVAGYLCCIDVTARNIQSEAKKQGHPWTLSKSCDTFTPISEIIPRRELTDEMVLKNGVELYLSVNDEMRQKDSTLSMTWSIPELLAYISSYIQLEAGDVVLTGTPGGVGPLEPGDKVLAGIQGITEMRFDVAARPMTQWELSRHRIESQ
uniref:Fumarylacetoacetase-like C-terminal domain-containing protein n=1 Tax=Timspurckia oligopyrenoides TaxID=708627 RepID=A0A7S0ZF56_9RHOD|mmetsp:Transcript_2968/g.5223  ORF Transcript_2968/g.5223 Transcript_2968/m.5223 type:complete len:258 (+) Transcript_2968:951-1724(+)